MNNSYNEFVTAHFFNTKMAGTLDCNQPLTVNYRAGNVARGQFFDLYLQCDKPGFITTARFQANGSPYLIAGLEYLCRKLEGYKISAPLPYTPQELAQRLDLPKKQQSVVLLIDEGCQYALKLLKENAGV